jgi:hypothetical protein
VISDQVDDRQGAFGKSLSVYVDGMLKAGKAREGYEFLTGVRPEIAHYDEISSDMQGLMMQWGSIGLMTGFETFENRKTAWNQFTGELDEVGFPWRKKAGDDNNTWDALMNGNVDQAVDHFLEYELAVPVAKDLNRHRKPFRQLFAPIYDDPRVAAKLIERAERFAEVREEVRAMLQRPEWENP